MTAAGHTGEGSEHASRQGPSRRLVAAAAGLIGLLGLVVLVVIVLTPAPTGDPGRLTETVFDLPADVELPVMIDATEAWGLADTSLMAAADPMAGGAAIADLDGDRRNELIVANGEVVVFRWSDGRYEPLPLPGIEEAIGVTTADVDLDGLADVLVATAGDTDVVIWGGDWVASGSRAPVTELVAAGQSSGLLAGELSGDGLIDIVRLGRGMDDPVPDILWTATDRRVFSAVELPLPDRFSLAGELVDVDGDDLLDIWLTRDVGWAAGGDSVLSRQGDPAGQWVDIASAIGADLQVDGMGITLADLNGDAMLDAYVSDLGDNEQLLGSSAGFAPTYDTGAAHIRPVGAPDTVVSSTWGTGALDVNLDGVLDLVAASGGFPNGGVRNKIDNTEVAVAEAPAVLLGRGDGTFVDVWSSLGIDLDIVARGLVVGDLDRDGDDDLLIVGRTGSLHALRNDTQGATVTTFVAADCGYLAGRVATVTTDVGSYQRLLGPHGYASSHAAEVIVGNPSGGATEIEVTGSYGELVERAPWIDSGDPRPSWSFECG